MKTFSIIDFLAQTALVLLLVVPCLGHETDMRAVEFLIGLAQLILGIVRLCLVDEGELLIKRLSAVYIILVVAYFILFIVIPQSLSRTWLDIAWLVAGYTFLLSAYAFGKTTYQFIQSKTY